MNGNQAWSLWLPPHMKNIILDNVLQIYIGLEVFFKLGIICLLVNVLWIQQFKNDHFLCFFIVCGKDLKYST
jgi:hypothetical protein